MSIAIKLAERGLVPDRIIRMGIRKLLSERLKSVSESGKADEDWAAELSQKPLLAEQTDTANEQHYDIPPQYFQTVLGKHLKYSCGYWSGNSATLDESEASMLQLSCDRAELSRGQR
ncbi:MAG TPA: class I SAM-dependent methyltransferase, partial [Opitutales bacterium]|nr:class I SAM-dependent methyltransferase [Opitutales bacterium]